MDQRISIEPPGLYTDAGLAARMHSRRLLRRTNGWWMHGMRHIGVGELTLILIHYAKTKRYVSFLLHVTWLHSYFQIKCDSMKLLADMKTKTKCAVDSSFQFETGQAADSIGRNASLAQTLLDKTTFIYQVRVIALHYGQLSMAICFTGFRLWRTPTLSVPKPHNPKSCQHHVVPEPGRHRHCLLPIL